MKGRGMKSDVARNPEDSHTMDRHRYPFSRGVRSSLAPEVVVDIARRSRFRPVLS